LGREGLEGGHAILGVGVDEEGKGESEVGEEEQEPDPTGREGFEGCPIIVVVG